MNLAEQLSLISNLVVCITAIIVAVATVIGLGTWRAQIQGQAQFELAREMIRLASLVRDEYYRARYFFISDSEVADRVTRPNETDDEARLLDEQHARLKRIKPLSEAVDHLVDRIPEAEEILQSDIAHWINPLVKEKVQLFDSIYYYYSSQLGRVRGDNTQTITPEQDESYLKTFRAPHPRAAMYGEIDETGKRVDQEIDTLKQELRKFLKQDRYGFIGGWFRPRRK